MGGLGSGGKRVGSGRKSKSSTLAMVHGSRGVGSRLPPAVAPVSGAAPVVPPPDDMPAEQLEVWTAHAPHAITHGTLTPDTATAFRDLCEAIVVKRSMLAQIQNDGLTYVKVTVDGAGTEHSEIKAHPLIAQHRGMMQRVEQGMLRFRLSPDGKPRTADAGEQKAKSPLEKLQDQSAQMRRVK